MGQEKKNHKTEQLSNKLHELRVIVNINVASYVNAHPSFRVYEEDLASDIFTQLCMTLPEVYNKTYVKHAISNMLANHARNIVGKKRNSRIQYLTGLQPVSKTKKDDYTGKDKDDEIDKLGYVDAVMHGLGMLDESNPRTELERKEARKLIRQSLQKADVIVVKVLSAYLAGLSTRETARLYELSKTRVSTIIQEFIAELSEMFN